MLYGIMSLLFSFFLSFCEIKYVLKILCMGVKLRKGDLTKLDFRGQFDRGEGYLDSWQNIPGMFLGEISV